MDTTEPPSVVIEQPAACKDSARAEEQLRRALSLTQSPDGAWTVHVVVTNRANALHADVEIADAESQLIAHRTFEAHGSECLPLTRAAAVWVSLVFDSEADKLREKQPQANDPPPVDEKAPGTHIWPAPAVNLPPSPEQAVLLQHPAESRSLEIGLGSFMTEGFGTPPFIGPSAFAVVEGPRGIFFRPGILLARGTRALRVEADEFATFAAARFDTCLRVPGFYRDGEGIQLDGCMGLEGGIVDVSTQSGSRRTGARTLGFLAVGPAISLRGDLSKNLALELRGLANLNILRGEIHDGEINVSPDSGNQRLELGMTWRIR